MKRCPQCNNVFDDALIYCQHDGATLISENFPLPSESAPVEDEEITVIRHEPVNVQIPQSDVPTEQFQNPIPQVQPVLPVVAEQRNTGKYLAFLIIGLLLGGILVLATLLLARNFYQDKPTEISVNGDKVMENNSTQNAKAEPSEIPKTPDPKHERRTETTDEEFNGRVITLNAYVRSSPSRNSSEVDVLPIDDRLTILNRENENSPWFFVTCEHGANGWMHGNTIEYTR